MPLCHLLSKCLKNAVLGRQKNGVMQIFFLTPHRNIFAGKFINSERFWVGCVLAAYYFPCQGS